MKIECKVYGETMEIELKENEEINDLEYKGLRIIQNKKEFCFGIDSVLLAHFAKDIKAGSKVLDLGTGTGIVGILLCEKSRLKEIIGVEIQKHVCELAIRNIALNQLENKFKIINENIANLGNIIPPKSIDAIVTNPPYKKENTGIINENKAKQISRHEIFCKLEEIISVSAKVLKNNGEMYMINRPERLADILISMRENNLEPKVIRFVHSKESNPPKLTLIKAVKNAKEFLKIEKPLIIYQKEGSYTEEILEIYERSNI